MGHGYLGKVLQVDLSSKTCRDVPIVENTYRRYFGGYGLGVHLLTEAIAPGTDPLGSSNVLGFFPGLLTGTAAPFTGRHMVCGKSPLTGSWGDSNCGGFFGAAIRRAGYDGILVHGKADTPSYLLIDGDTKEILDASHVWGKDVVETERILKAKHGAGCVVEGIGRAGENLSLISGIVTDGGRIAARSGFGAVMGSKMLKALCLKGRQKPHVADKERLLSLAKDYREMVASHGKSVTTAQAASVAPKMAKLYRLFSMPAEGDDFMYGYTLANYGTAFATSIYSEIGDMPIKNFKGVGHLDWPQEIAKTFSGHALKKYRKKAYGCFGCPLKCGSILEVPECGLSETHAPEYETLAAFGGMITNPDVEEAILANHLLNLEGMDTISAGSTIAFAMECVERGILGKEDFECAAHPDGFLPRWGDGDHVIALLELMISREGIGDVLADGVKRASEKIGKGSQGLAMHAGGQELPMHDGRYIQGLALTYAADPTPGRHTAASLDFSSLGPVNKFVAGLSFPNSTDPHGKGSCSASFAKFRQSFNALGLCEYALPQGRYPLLEIINAVTGWSVDMDELLEIGWRIQVERHLFNIREGIKIHEVAPRALGIPPMERGPLKGKVVPLQQMIAGYFEGMGLDSHGIPLAATLETLGLSLP